MKARGKLRRKDGLVFSDRRRQNSQYGATQFDAPWRPEDDYLLINSVFVVSQAFYSAFHQASILLEPFFILLHAPIFRNLA